MDCRAKLSGSSQSSNPPHVDVSQVETASNQFDRVAAPVQVSPACPAAQPCQTRPVTSSVTTRYPPGVVTVNRAPAAWGASQPYWASSPQ